MDDRRISRESQGNLCLQHAMMINNEYKWVNAITDPQIIFLLIAYFYCFHYLQVCRV